MSSGFVMLAVGLAVVMAGYVALTRHFTSREVTAVASLGALSAAGRVVFAPIPGVQPSTVIIILSGWVLGPAPGFVVGVTTAVVSNVFLGHGPWTVWQMLAWGSIGAGAGLVGRVEPSRPVIWITVYAAVCGLLFGWVMDLWFWVSFVYPHTWATLMASVATSIVFDVMHAVGNVIFAAVFVPRGLVVMRRFRERTRIEYRAEVPV